MTDRENESPDRFEQWLADQARSLDAPPPTPREAMWANILAAVPAAGATGQGPRATGGGRGRWLLPAAIAAALVLGVGIDRFVISRGSAPVAPVTVAVRPSADSAPAAKTDTSVVSPAPVERTTAPNETRIAPEPRRYAEATTTPRAPRPSPRRAATDLYRVATVQMLAQAEVLLTTYREDENRSADAATMQRVGVWAKDVLSSTRLLIDSPVGSDARMRPLLDDLELALVQLVRLSGAPLTNVERAAIDRTLRERDLLPRIRTVVPSGTSVPTV